MTDIIHLRPNTEVNLFAAPTHLYRPARLNNNSGTPIDRHASQDLGAHETTQRTCAVSFGRRRHRFSGSLEENSHEE